MSEQLLSTGDVAKMYGVSTETIRRWVRKGILGYVQVGTTRLKRRAIRIPQSDAEKHLTRVPPVAS